MTLVSVKPESWKHRLQMRPHTPSASILRCGYALIEKKKGKKGKSAVEKGGKRKKRKKKRRNEI